ncbi:excisionase [Edwardsiella piscicida]
MLTIEQWNERQPIRQSLEIIRRHIRAGRIYPAPIKYGRRWIFDEKAILTSVIFRRSLLDRVKEDGKTKKIKKPRPTS